MKETSFNLQISYDDEKLCALRKYMKDDSELRAGIEALLDSAYRSRVPAEVRADINRRNQAAITEEPMTLEQFVREHPDDTFQIMSPGGYVTISPDRPLEKLLAHAGERGTEMAVTWEELKDQVVENCHYDPSDRSWRLLTDDPALNDPIQSPGMRQM